MNAIDTRPETQAQFLSILDRESEQAQILLDLLEQEYRMLGSAPDEALDTLLNRKKQQLAQVEQSASAHHRFLQSQGLSADRRGTEAYLEACGDNPPILVSWQRYVGLIEACQKQNEINGGAVAANQRQVNQALNLLLGLGDGNKTYGRTGESQPARPSKTLGKA